MILFFNLVITIFCTILGIKFLSWMFIGPEKIWTWFENYRKTK